MRLPVRTEFGPEVAALPVEVEARVVELVPCDFAAAGRMPYIPSMSEDFPPSTDLLVIGHVGFQPHSFRAVLEEFGTRVNMLPVGRPTHIVAVLSGQDGGAPWLVISCHGAAQAGTVQLDVLDEAIAAGEPFNDVMTPDDVRQHANLPGRVVFSSGCETGHPALANAFLEAGVRAYIAPERAPFGWSGTAFLTSLLYELRCGRALDETVERIRARDEEMGMYRLFKRD